MEDATPPAGRAAGAEVRLDHVAKSYGAGVQAVRDVSLRVPPGEFLLLTGRSGSGKSTLLNLIGSLDRPDSGEIVVDGASLADAHPTDYRRTTVGFVFQLHHLLPMLTAAANVEVPLIATGVRRGERRARARELLAEVGLERRTDHLPSQLSGGERQRVAIARALSNHPRLLLADEPTGALDSESARQVLRLLAQIRERHGMTLIMVSYDPTVGEDADRVVGMVDGRLVDRGSAPMRGPGPEPEAGERPATPGTAPREPRSQSR